MPNSNAPHPHTPPTPDTLLARLVSSGETVIWLAALGYFLFYIVYSGLPKLFFTPDELHKVSGWNLLPSAAFAAVATTIAIFTALGWWRHAGHKEVFGLRVPVPSRWAIWAGVALSGIVLTTPLLYTHKPSIAMAGLLSRGGVLLLAPIADALTRQTLKRFWWVAWLMALLAVYVATGGLTLSLQTSLILILSLYIFAYLVRFTVIGRRVKATAWPEKRRFFVEEQMVAAPAFLVLTVLLALFAPGEVGEGVRKGFTMLATLAPGVPAALLTGVLGVCTGLFATLIFIDQQAFAVCVPINRASGVFAQVTATALIFWFFDGKPPRLQTLIGAAILMAALIFLAFMNRPSSSPSATRS